MSREPKPRICENCIYLYNTSYEYSEYVCAAGVTEDDEHFTGDGCTYHWNKLRAMKNANDKLWGKAHTITEEDLKIFLKDMIENLKKDEDSACLLIVICSENKII